MAQANEGFGPIRTLFWPIHNFELKKFLPMFFMFFGISFNYTILRDLKDALVLTAPGSGAEAIPFLKVWCVVPSAVILTLIFAKLSNLLSKENLFYATLLPFVIFFGFFGFVIYPNREFFHPAAETVQSWAAFMPDSAAGRGITGILANWTYAIFYILAELWGSMCLTLLFWSFANDITRTTEAKRFYGLLGIGANLALIFSGRAIVWANDPIRSFDVSLEVLMAMVVVAGLSVAAIYWWMNREVLTDPRFFDPGAVKKKKDKPKLGFAESFKFLSRSKYLGCIAFLVIGYGASINLIEVVWKAQLKELYPATQDYMTFMGYFSAVTGAVTCFMFLFVSHNVIRRLGWTFAALCTPVVLMITGALFIAFVVFRDSMTGFAAMFGATPLFMAVIFGAAQNIMSKATKYSLFDPTKEMAYIPLDQESKIKGKAAIDVVGARFGKSGGSMIQQGLMFFLPTAVAMAPFVAIICGLVIVGWMKSSIALGSMYGEKVADQEAEEAKQQARDRRSSGSASAAASPA